jgi:hypothetical protein
MVNAVNKEQDQLIELTQGQKNSGMAQPKTSRSARPSPDTANTAKHQQSMRVFLRNAVLRTSRCPDATRCQPGGSAMNKIPRTKAQRRRLHGAINALGHEDVAAIVRGSFPGIRAAKLNQIAKAVIPGAHRQVSPRPPLSSAA